MVKNMVRVHLVGADNVTHAEGYVEFDKIADARLVERNGHTYAFEVTSRINLAVFKECGPPILITEF